MTRILNLATAIGMLGLACEPAPQGEALCVVRFGAIQNGSEDPKEPPHPLLNEAASQLLAYFAGKLRQFSLPLAPDGTNFQKEVWRELLHVPYGETASYRELAVRLGRPNAARAVGGACHNNPVAIIIPCHRVVGAKGNLTGYAGGLDLKRDLLALERAAR